MNGCPSGFADDGRFNWLEVLTSDMDRGLKVSSKIMVKNYSRAGDVSDIRYVINFDYPNNVEDYIHRIGRTARHNSSGTAHVFVTEEDASKASALINVLRDVNQNVCPELESLAKSAQPSKVNKWYGRGYPKSRFGNYNRKPYNKKW